MVNFPYKDRYDIHDFRKIMEILRRPEDGCPWDSVQTHESVRRNMIEEAYEAVAAINHGDKENLCEELGDLQMQVLFHARMEEEVGGFTFDDVCDMACKKLIRRHPHVFGGVSADSAEEGLAVWDAAKRAEKKQTSTAGAMADVADALPALWRAEKVQGKAAKDGFDWPDWHGARDKVGEELAEVDEAIAQGDTAHIEEEIGDLLAAVVHLSRMLGIDPEKALGGSTDKFIRRYTRMEELAAAGGQKLPGQSLEALDALWKAAKAEEG